MDSYFYYCDFEKKEVIRDCPLNPTDVWKTNCPWLYARNNKYNNVESDLVGKWMLFVKPSKVNSVWYKIKVCIREGILWNAKVSTKDPNPQATHAIMIYTKDYKDLDDVIQVLEYLEMAGIKTPESVIRYKTDEQTRAGIYAGGSQNPWIYISSTIREKKESLEEYWRNQSTQ